MKRKYVLMVPVAAVTLWANSSVTLVSAQSLQDINNNKTGCMAARRAEQTKIQPNKDNKQITKNDKKDQNQQNPQVAPKAPEKENC